MTCGIYIIRHKASGKVYVGSAADIEGRWKTHRHQLRHGKHHSTHLQRAWVKYGEAAFEFCIVERVDLDLLIAREQSWIDETRAADQAHGYNIAPLAHSRRGTKQSDEARAKMKAAWAARSDKERADLSAKWSAIRQGRKHSPETLAKMRGQKRSEETCERIGAAHRGRTIPPERRARISATLRGRKLGPQTPEQIAKRVAATRATKLAKLEAAQ